MLKRDDVTTENESFLSLLKCHLKEETMQRGMDAVSSGT